MDAVLVLNLVRDKPANRQSVDGGSGFCRRRGRYRVRYHGGMAMNLRLSEEDTKALRTYAAEHGTSMQQAAVDGIREMLHSERRARLIEHILEEDRELLHRLAQ